MFKIVFLILVLVLYKYTASANSEGQFEKLYKTVSSIKECFYEKYIGVCLKERALEALNETTLSDEPITIGILNIEKNKNYSWNHTVELPTDLQQRSATLTDVLWEKFYEFFRSRTVRVNIWDAMVEGRGKKGGGGLGGKKMMMMAACAGTGMMMGKMGMMAAGAMMMSKLALLMTLIMLLKKSKGGGGDEGGGEEKKIKIVYAASDSGGDYGKGGGGGGWHRSLSSEPQSQLAYRAHTPSENTNVVYEDYANKDSSNNRRCEVLVDKHVGTENIPGI